MSAEEITKSAKLSGRSHARSHDSGQRILRARLTDLPRQSFGHRVSGFAERNDEHPRIRVEIKKIFANPQNSPLAVHVATKGTLDRSLRQSLPKYFPCCIAHLASLGMDRGVSHHRENYRRCIPSCLRRFAGKIKLYAFRGGRVSRSQSSIVCRISCSRPAKK